MIKYSLLHRFFLLSGVLVCVCVTSHGVEAAEAAGVVEAPTVVKKKDGLRFNVPSDWPVEERNGAVGPIPIEEYLARKFSSLESRLRLLEQQISSFDLRLRVMEEESKKQSRQGGGLRSMEQAP